MAIYSIFFFNAYKSYSFFEIYVSHIKGRNIGQTLIIYMYTAILRYIYNLINLQAYVPKIMAWFCVSKTG